MYEVEFNLLDDHATQTSKAILAEAKPYSYDIGL